MLVYFLKAQVKIAEQPGMMLYGNPPRWHKFNPAVHTDASQSHYHAKKATEIAAAKEAAKGWTKEHDGQSPEQHIAAMKDKAKAIQAKASASAVITGWKQTLLAGKTPTPSQAKAAAELAATNPTKAAAVLKEIIDVIGADKAEALMHASHAKAHQQVAQEAQAAVATKDAAIQEAIAHLEQDSGQGDLPEAEKQEDAALVDKLKAAKDAPASAAAPKPAAAPEPAPTVAPTTVDTVQTDAAPPQPKHTFTNAKEGMESYVTPGVGPSQGKWRVTLKDLDSGETLPTIYVVDSEAAAIAKAKKIVNLPSTPSTSAPAAAPTVTPPPAQPATPTATAQDVLQAELDAMKLPATNTNAKVVNAKIAKLAALVQAGDHAALASEKFGSNNYQKKLAKFAAKASGALAVAHAAPEDDDWAAALFGAEPQAADVPKTATVNGVVLTHDSGGWYYKDFGYWPGSSQYAAAELLTNGTVAPNDLANMSLEKKQQAVGLVVDQGVDPKKALNKLMAVAADGPFEGDTHTVNGVTYVLHNGRWHRQTTTPEAQVTPAMKDAAIAAAFKAKGTWADLQAGWERAVSKSIPPTLGQAGVYEMMEDYQQQDVLGKLVEKQLNLLTPAQFVALSKQASDAGAVHVNAFLADQYLALHAKTLQQGATAPASAPAITTTINGVEFTKANGVWSATNGGPEFGPGTMPYLAAELYAGLHLDPAVLKQHDPSVLSMVVGDLAKDGQDPVKLLNAVFPNGGVDGAYGEGAVFMVGIQDFVLKSGKWQEQPVDVPPLAANLPGPATQAWVGGSADTPDVAGWYATMMAGKTPNKAQQQAAKQFLKDNPKDGVAMKTAIWNCIGKEQYKLQLKPHLPHQYSQADQVDILQDWVHTIAYGKQPTAKMALIFDGLPDQAKQDYWVEQALNYWAEQAGFDPDDDDAMQAAKDKLQGLQNAALGLPAVQPSDTEVKPPVTVQFDGMTYTKTSASTWSSAFGDVAAEDGPNFVTLTVLAGQKPRPAHLAMLSDQQKDVALFSLNYSGLATDAALNAVYPPASAGQTWPQEGDTKTYKGVTYILHNGRWHLMNQAAPSGGSVVYMADHVKKLSKLGYTASLLNGKVPTKAQHQAYLQALTAASDANLDMQLLINTHNDLINTGIGKDAHDDLKLQMHQAMSGTAPAAPTPTVVLTKPLTAEPDDTESWAFDASSQKGSNLGGLYTDKSGQKWYVKVPKSEAHARNELLAAKLYEAAGVAAPTLKLVKSNGQVAIASQWVDGMQQVGAGIKSASGALEGFAVDAWLANYDSVGTGYDNLLKDAQGKAVRIDVGGALLFRAQGEPKTFFSDQVTELQSMLNPALNSYSAAVFGGISADQIKAGAAKVAAITPDQIKQMVQQYGPGTATEKAALADKLIARREDLLKKHPVAAAKIKKPANKVTKQVATPSAPPFDPSKLGTPPDFMSWGASGSPGPSSVLAVNEANQEATQAIYAAAQTGDVAAVTAVEGKLVDKATGQVTGTAPVLQHPSQHISSFAQQMVNEIEEQKIVKAVFAWGTGQSALEAIDKMSDVVKDFATKSVKKIGYFIELSRPGVVGKVSDLITAAKVTWKSGKLTEQTYAKQAQAAYVKIPKAQLQALASYTDNGYHEINKSLWQGNPMGAAKAAEKALHTYGHAVQEGTILSRKLDLYGTDLQDFLKSEGAALQEPAVMSTSIDPSVWSGNVHLKLHVGPGVKGLYVGYGSVPGGGAISENATEKELLLPPNTRIYVVSIKKTQKDPNTSYSKLKDVDGFGGNSDYIVECVVLPTKPL